MGIAALRRVLLCNAQVLPGALSNGRRREIKDGREPKERENMHTLVFRFSGSQVVAIGPEEIDVRGSCIYCTVSVSVETVLVGN